MVQKLLGSYLFTHGLCLLIQYLPKIKAEKKRRGKRLQT
jgi:hypothetical protein